MRRERCGCIADPATGNSAWNWRASLVLMEPQNRSTTFTFAQLVQHERLGRLIGEPTGGNRCGINSGAFFNIRLPGSKLEVDLPLIGTFPGVEQPDAC